MEQKGSYERALKEKVRTAVFEYGMLTRGMRVLVAFSGGADSTALLSVLSSLSDELGITVGAFHLEHGIRGEESLADESHCRRFCENRGIEYFSEHVSVPAVSAETGEGIEEAARRIRYERLSAICAERGYDRVATAHHADDNVETVLFRLARGTGIRGLCGIPPVRRLSGVFVIRPFIECDRELIEDYLGEIGLGYVTDSTNVDQTYSRNRIRCSVIPELKKINPSLTVAVSRLCRQAALAEDAIEAAAGLPCTAFGSEQPEEILRRRLIADYRDFVLSEGICDEKVSLEAVHIDALVKLSTKGELWGRVSLPHGVTAIKERAGVSYEREGEKNTADEKKTLVPLHAGWNFLPEGDSLYLSQEGKPPFSEESHQNSIIKKAGINIYKLSIHISVNYAKLNGNLHVRKRVEGDRIRSRGMTRRVKKLLSAARMSLKERAILPIVTDDDGIVWIPGIALKDGVCPSGSDAIEIHYLSRENTEILFGSASEG